MKYIFLLLPLLMAHTLSEESGFYGIKFNTINGVLINTNSYKGKKVIVALVTVSNSSQKVLSYLDSVQRASTDIQVVAVPTGEFGNNITVTDLKNLQKKSKLTITEPLKVKKMNGPQQHPFFEWLTKATKNGHFDADADEEGKTFIISAKGTLYSIVTAQTPKEVINGIINQNFND